PRSPLCPYTTLFRSLQLAVEVRAALLRVSAATIRSRTAACPRASGRAAPPPCRALGGASQCPGSHVQQLARPASRLLRSRSGGADRKSTRLNSSHQI